ncbi:hypothetical protein DITRI_Ditri03aG0177700 [Diplodiscus trichospermus]
MADLSLPHDALFLGFDSSTQSLKATVLDSNLVIVASELVHFDSDLPHYKTKNGVYRDSSVNGRIVSPTIMWVEALDLILQRLSKSNLDFGKIAAVSGSGQQHGSVYWKIGSSALLSSLDPKKPLVDQLGDAFSLDKSPIWMDCSTTAQCRESYWSSFMACIFIGAYDCIDETDGAGMNLMDIKQRIWSKVALEATAPGLEEKLGKLAPPAYAVAGPIASYFVERFNFNKNCLAVQWSGDNPNSLAGLTLNTPGDIAISLGTSDTVFGITKDLQPSLEGHVFPNPVDREGYMVMLVYKNGSLTREDVRNRYAEKSWDVFNKFLEQTPPLNGGKIGFFYKEHEILPPLPVGFHHYLLENFTDETLDGLNEQEVLEFDPPFEVRALIEGQFLSMRAHAERFGMPSPPKRIIATGGASANQSILSSIASIFGCDIYTVQRHDSASLGAALRAAHGWLCSKKGSFVPISSMYKDLDKTSLSCKLSLSAGDPNLVSKYALLMKKRIEIENGHVQKLGRC